VLEHGAVSHFGPRDEILRMVAPDAIPVIQPKRPQIRIIPRATESA
jgi:hypothetical protein